MKQITTLAAFATLFITLLSVATAARPGPAGECDTMTSSTMEKKKGFSDDFEPRPNVSAYGGDKTKLKYADDFEPRPNVSAYGGDDNKVVETERKFADDFEPRPNVSAYGGDDDVENQTKYANDFEPRPNVSAYGDI